MSIKYLNLQVQIRLLEHAKTAKSSDLYCLTILPVWEINFLIMGFNRPMEIEFQNHFFSSFTVYEGIF